MVDFANTLVGIIESATGENAPNLIASASAGYRFSGLCICPKPQLTIQFALVEPKQRKRWSKRALWIAASLLTVVLVFAIIEHLRGRWMLSRRIAGLMTQGEKLQVTDLTPARVESGQNAVADLLPLTNRVSLMISNLGLLPPTGRFASPGKAVLGIKLSTWSYKEETNNWLRIQ